MKMSGNDVRGHLPSIGFAPDDRHCVLGHRDVCPFDSSHHHYLYFVDRSRDSHRCNSDHGNFCCDPAIRSLGVRYLLVVHTHSFHLGDILSDRNVRFLGCNCVRPVGIDRSLDQIVLFALDILEDTEMPVLEMEGVLAVDNIEARKLSTRVRI